MSLKVTVLYLHVSKSGYPGAAPPEYYLPFSQRWVNTYLAHNPGYPHKVRALYAGAEPTSTEHTLYSGVADSHDVYLGAGSDIGACQDALTRLTDRDLVVCMSTPVYFWRSGWLARLVEAYEKHGDRMYGPMASYQNLPHIRTSCWAVNPVTFGQYPHLIDTREKCCWAESQDHGDELWQISKWYASIGKEPMLVTWDEELTKADWRKPANIFRRGDQSNCMVWDQHVDVYFAAHYHERLAFEKLSDTNNENSALIHADS